MCPYIKPESHKKTPRDQDQPRKVALDDPKNELKVREHLVVLRFEKSLFSKPGNFFHKKDGHACLVFLHGSVRVRISLGFLFRLACLVTFIFPRDPNTS